MPFQQAIVRTPSKSLAHGLTTSAELGSINYTQACLQHRQYVDALRKCGLEVTVLEALDAFPDSCFVEDPALVTPKIGICTRPGAITRQREVSSIEPILRRYYPNNLHKIESPGLLDGGDVLQIEHHFHIGLSSRTNSEGAAQLSALLGAQGYTASTVNVNHLLHLKTGISYLGNHCVLISKALIDCPEFSGYTQMIVEEEEAYAANALMINGTVLMAKGFPKTQNALLNQGFKVVSIDVSEFRKIDGGLSCLSLRF